MSGINSYQDSLNPYQDTSVRTETDADLQRIIEQGVPGEEEGARPSFVPTVTRDENGQRIAEPPQPQQTQQTQTEAPEQEAQAEQEAQEQKEHNLNLFQQATEWVATEVLGQDPEERAQQREEAAEYYQKSSERIENAGGLEGATRDGIRAIAGGIEKGYQDLIGGANFLGDLAKTKLGMVAPDDVWNNTDHKDYKGSDRDLILAQPTSSAGLFARDMVSFVTGSRAIGAATGLTKAGQAAKAIGGVKGFAAERTVEAVVGAATDFMMDPGDGNAANALQEFFPSLKDNDLLSVFAHSSDDNEFSRRAKNLVEGAVMQQAVDAVGLGIKAIYKGSEPLRAWLSANPGAKSADAPAEIRAQAMEALKTNLFHGTFASESILAKGFKKSSNTMNVLGEGVYFATDPRYAKAYGEEVLEGSDMGMNILDLNASNKSVMELLDEMELDSNRVKFGDFEGNPIDREAFDALDPEDRMVFMMSDQKLELQRKLKEAGYDGIKYDPTLTKADPGAGEEVLIFDPAKADEVIAPRVEYVPSDRPGADFRKEEAHFNGGTRSNPDYEPYERGGRSSEFPLEEVSEQIAFNQKGPRFSPGAPNPHLTDNTIRQIGELGGDAEVVKKAYTAAEEFILPRLNSKDPEMIQQAFEQINKFNKANEQGVDMSALTELVDEQGMATPYLKTLLGDNVAKVLVADASNQLSELASTTRQITDSGMDANKQYNLLFDRLKALTQLQVNEGSARGSKLAVLTRTLSGNSGQAAKKRIGELHEKIEGLRTRVNEGDPNAAAEVKTLADSLVLADGDAEMSQTFTEKFFKYGKENFEVTLYNSYLSGLNTQSRNILGNSTNLLLKPITMALGSLGNPRQARAAMSMYVGMIDSITEGFSVARTAFANSGKALNATSMVEASAYKGMHEGAQTSQNMLLKLKDLRASAKTPAEHAGATLISAQYHMMANPWLQGATRMLDAADRGFKVISARQKHKYDMVNMAIEDGIGFDPKKYEISLQNKIKDGEIIDEELLKWAQVDTFQEELTGNMAKFAEMTQTLPFAKYVIPFVKTPTNILSQTASYIPLAGRLVYNTALGDVFAKEYSKVMRGSDETAKAIYRGREGVGIMVGAGFLSLGFQGISTGAGPRDPQARQVWLENNRPHSVKIGGQWVSNRFLGPVGILMSAYSDLGMLASDRGKYESFSELAGQLMYATAGSLADQSWFKGLFSVMDGLNDLMSGKADSLDPGEFTANIARAMTPYQAALRAWNNTLNPGIREYNNAFEQYLAETVPGMKPHLGAERLSLRTGLPVMSQGYSALNQAVPFGLNEVKTDPVIEKMMQLGIDIPMEFADKYKGVELTATEHQELTRRVANSGVWEELDSYLNSKYFEGQYEEWKNQNPPTSRDGAEWYLEARGLLTDAKEQAIREYRAENTPEAIEFDNKIRQIDDMEFHNRKGNYQTASAAKALMELAN